MEPSPDDIADTLTATYRRLDEMTVGMNEILAITWITQVLLAIAVGIAVFILMRKAMDSVQS